MSRLKTLAVLLLTLNLLLAADYALRRRDDSMVVSVLDLTVTGRKPVAAYHMGAENTHAELVRIAQAMADPANPFGASADDRAGATRTLQALRASVRRAIWLELRILERLSSQQRQAFTEALFDRNLDPTRDNVTALREALGSPASETKAVPPDWEPSKESESLLQPWHDLFDSLQMGRHLFLDYSNRTLVVWITRDPRLRTGKKAAPLRDLAIQLLSMREQMESQRGALETLVRRMPGYTPGEDVGQDTADTSLLEVYSALPR